MKGVNEYWRQLSDEQIAEGEHRLFVGGMWEELGSLQIDFLRRQGLRPENSLIDIGCGALRGGIRFVRYLDAGNYYGLDQNASLIEAGRRELEEVGLSDRGANLLVNDRFELSRLAKSFDFGLALSLFTHLGINQILRCLAEMRLVMTRRSRFFCTYFEAPSPVHLDTIAHEPGGIVTHFDRDPFHYAFAEMAGMAEASGLEVEKVEDWKHPRAQRMLLFTLSD